MYDCIAALLRTSACTHAYEACGGLPTPAAARAQALARADCKALHAHWALLLPVATPLAGRTQAATLVDVAVRDPTPRARLVLPAVPSISLAPLAGSRRKRARYDHAMAVMYGGRYRSRVELGRRPSEASCPVASGERNSSCAQARAAAAVAIQALLEGPPQRAFLAIAEVPAHPRHLGRYAAAAALESGQTTPDCDDRSVRGFHCVLHHMLQDWLALLNRVKAECGSGEPL